MALMAAALMAWAAALMADGGVDGVDGGEAAALMAWRRALMALMAWRRRR